ncbi:MAG: sulfatase-like hydrolase/transferase [Desulfobacula sp.]|nr:sulfatase-like hydrolase/transferase [Desulfobacula sp.]
MQANNLLLIMSDEHDPRYMGASGHPVVKTPCLDRLAERGICFTNAYTPSPICVPARASFATGRYTYENRYWDNAMGYDGKMPGWGHRLQEVGNRVEAIGKLHYRKKEDPLGFDHQINPMHLHDGIGQVWGSIRDPLPESRGPRMFNKIGPGVSNYNIYDRQSANEACKWLKQHEKEKHWMLYVGLAAPHFPLVVPREYLDLYPEDCLPPRKLHPRDGYQHHPWIQAQEHFMAQENLFADDEERQLARRAYYGLCTFMDSQIGLILDALEDYGLADSTRVIYTSDHGDNLGARGLWGKSNLYEESTKIPMIIAGPQVPRGQSCKTPVSLVDCYPTILQGVGISLQEEEQKLPGKSLFELMNEPENSERVVLSEYHAVGSISGAFMLRKGRFKYHYYVGLPPELFDLENDPEETVDLAKDDGYASVLKMLEKELRQHLDPEAVDAKAKADQDKLIKKFGGRKKALRMGAMGATPAPGQESE